MILRFLKSLFFIKKKLQTGSYILYLIKINISKLEYMLALANANFNEVVQIKTNWAKYVIKNSSSGLDREISREYLRIISTDNITNNKSIVSKKEFSAQEVFYIFGPNAEYPPSLEHPNHRLVLTKPLTSDKNFYKNPILFVNAEYYFHKISSDEAFQKHLARTYSMIFVKDKNKTLKKPFFNSEEPIMGNIAAPMALGIIIYNLIKKFGMTQCVITGFDFYTKKETYAKNYPSLMGMKDETIDAEKLFLSLADHDPIYDFLYVKNLILKNNIQIIKSLKFCEIMSLTPENYFSKLCSARNFKPLDY